MWESETDSDDMDNTSKNKYQSDVGNKNKEIATYKGNIRRSKEITKKSNSEKNVIVDTLMELNIPIFEDVTSMINSNVPFLIDGDALCMLAFLQESHEFTLGGQYLHCVYFCERFLQILADQGGNFIIVFFNTWETFWEKNSYIRCLRLSLCAHLLNFTKYKVDNFTSFVSRDFREFLDVMKPRCILLDIAYHKSIEEFNKRILSSNELLSDVQKGLIIICTEILFFRANDLPCIDICDIDIEISTISSFNLHSDPLLSIKATRLCQEHNKILTLPSADNEFIIQNNYSDYDARRVLVIIASSKFFLDMKDANVLKLILLTYASLEVLHLEHRCCPILKYNGDSLDELQKILLKWLDCLSSALKYCLKDNMNLKWTNVGDMWQGTMFSYICYIVSQTISSGSELGELQEAYENYIYLVKRECDIELEAYPIIPLQIEKVVLLRNKEYDKQNEINLYLLDNPLVKNFCGDAFQDVKWQKPLCSVKSQEFDEIRHWHCRKPLTDDFDRLKDTSFSKTAVGYHDPQYIEKWKQKQIARYAHYLDIYGRNLEGGTNKSEVIICETKDNVTKKAYKESKKASELKEKIKNEKEQKQLVKEEEIMKDLKNSLKYIAKIEQKLTNVNKVLQRLTMKEMILSAELLKLKIYREQLKKMRAVDIDINMVKDTFLVLKSILQNYTTITEKDKIFISKLLHELGFGEIAQRNNLPTNITFKEIFPLNWIRFQLEHLGEQMQRITGGEYDPDIGFTPDPWQSEFIDAVRKQKSALVVAPTSSGKTFAAYYCMKRVLKESKDGVVVYVAPTKALVNQVEATVYARFKNTKLPDGKSVVGVFTRDYKRNTLNSRILVTVPQCLDILLLSPRRYTWLKNLKYAIFDEVHKLCGNEEGLVWERCLLLIRCPFLALSATISDVPQFHQWLVANEMFKQEQDRLNGRMRNSYDVVLVEHTQRHSDLINYTYDIKSGLQHYHPYCALDHHTMKQHGGIPSTIHLSPREVLQLYDVMCLNASTRSKFTAEIDLFNFFSNICKSGFINRNDVFEYEKVIAEIYYVVHIEDQNTSRVIINNLKPNLTLYYSSKEDIPSLLNCMAERNLLPCIVFSYNRKLIEFANKFTTVECRKNEITDEDKKTRKMNDKLMKIERKMREKEEGSNKDQASKRNIKQSGILRFTGSKFKGEGKADSSDMEFIERRLESTSYNKNLISGLPYGVAYHHGGLNNKYRSTVEILFRMGIVKVVFATGTLALGIHMPCKSVVIFGDSPFLNSIEYHQMSGRAGRRGFDTEGNVIFMGLSKKRHDMLMTDKLPKMLGNFPVNVSLIARLLLLITKVTDNGKSSEEVTNVTTSVAITLLENSLIFKFAPNLKVQIKHFVNFAAELLYIQGIYSAEGAPLKLASIINHLHYHEPSNLVFAYLFRSGALRKFISSFKNPDDIEMGLIIVLSHLFARLKLHKLNFHQVFKNSVVILEPLPKIILKAVTDYNKEVMYIFNQYFISVATYLASSLGKDNTLPVSKLKIVPVYSTKTEEKPDSISAKIKSACVGRVACSSFVALSGNDDSNLYTGTTISNIKHSICPAIKMVPLLNTNIVHNSYAADFYRHGIVKAIVTDNGLKAGAEFSRLKDFLLVLKALEVCLEELDPIDKDDVVYTYFKKVSIKFDEKFKKAFD